MTTLDALLRPRRIALLGASDRAGSVGHVLASNLLSGGFSGEIDLVNPTARTICGRPAHDSVGALPSAPDLAVIATPAATAPGLVHELGSRGCRAAVVISAGFEGDNDACARLRQSLLDAARPHLLRIVGPNCLGVLSPMNGINASFARGAPPPGGLALVAQSGAVAAAALDWAPAHGLGFSHVVTLGDALDVDVADLLDHLGRDAETKAILLYVESLANARKFMSAARYAAGTKPVICLKGGRSRQGAKAAFSHTRALAGADDVFAAALRRAGVLQVDTLDELLDMALLYARGRLAPGGRLAILTNGGGAGVLAVDALERGGGDLAELSDATRAALAAKAPPHGVWRNPVDILGDAGPERYAASLAALLAAPEVDAVLAINCPTAVADSGAAADAVIAAAAQRPRKPVLAAWLGEPSVAEGRRKLIAAGVPSFPTAETAVRAYARLGVASGIQRLLSEAPDEASPRDGAGGRRIVERALDEGRGVLRPLEVQDLLQAYGVTSLPIRLAETPDAAGDLAASFGPGVRVALKLQSPDITHKSDVGGVALDLSGRGRAAGAARAMLRKVAALRPDARITGFLVQPMADRPKAHEVLAGLVRDPTFGPVVVVGHGGVAVEVVADRALGLPPLNAALARDMIGRTRVSRLLAGYRDRPAADLDALASILVALGQLATDLPEVRELDLNPVLCDAQGALVLDARVAVQRPAAGDARPAILPYPAHLRRELHVAGERLHVRPIRPTDAERLIALVDACARDDVHLRFGGGRLHLDQDLATRLSHIDYDRHMAFAAEAADGSLAGVGRLVEDPDGEQAEFALLVRTDHKRRGLGRALLQLLLDYAAGRGLRVVWGDVARENTAMRGLARALGFETHDDLGDPARVRVARAVQPTGKAPRA